MRSFEPICSETWTNSKRCVHPISRDQNTAHATASERLLAWSTAASGAEPQLPKNGEPESCPAVGILHGVTALPLEPSHAEF